MLSFAKTLSALLTIQTLFPEKDMARACLRGMVGGIFKNGLGNFTLLLSSFLCFGCPKFPLSHLFFFNTILDLKSLARTLIILLIYC